MLGWSDTCQVLLEAGADPSQVNVLGQNCLHLACKVRDKTEILDDDDVWSGWTDCMHACMDMQYRRVDLVNFILENIDLEVNGRDAMVSHNNPIIASTPSYDVCSFPVFFFTFLPTYLHTYLPTYLPIYLHTGRDTVAICHS